MRNRGGGEACREKKARRSEMSASRRSISAGCSPLFGIWVRNACRNVFIVSCRHLCTRAPSLRVTATAARTAGAW